jgi:hypothetical protein
MYPAAPISANLPVPNSIAPRRVPSRRMHAVEAISNHFGGIGADSSANPPSAGSAEEGSIGMA